MKNVLELMKTNYKKGLGVTLVDDIYGDEAYIEYDPNGDEFDKACYRVLSHIKGQRVKGDEEMIEMEMNSLDPWKKEIQALFNPQDWDDCLGELTMAFNGYVSEEWMVQLANIVD